MAKPIRLTRRQTWLLLNMGAGWLPILYGRRDQRATDGLLRLKLATAEGYPVTKGEAWSAEPTTLGRAMAALLARRTGCKLKRKGVQALAKHRARLLERFDVEASVANLETEIAAIDMEQRERELLLATRRMGGARG